MKKGYTGGGHLGAGAGLGDRDGPAARARGAGGGLAPAAHAAAAVEHHRVAQQQRAARPRAQEVRQAPARVPGGDGLRVGSKGVRHLFSAVALVRAGPVGHAGVACAAVGLREQECGQGARSSRSVVLAQSNYVLSIDRGVSRAQSQGGRTNYWARRWRT